MVGVLINGGPSYGSNMQSDNTKAFTEMRDAFTLHKGPGKVRILGVQNIVQWFFLNLLIVFLIRITTFGGVCFKKLFDLRPPYICY